MFQRMVQLVACLACAALAISDDSVLPYFEVSLGGHYTKSSYETESSTHWYHDKDRDEMVYDENLTYDIYSFEGGGPILDVQAGLTLGKRFIFLFDLGLAVSIGDSRYKFYSRDKEEYDRTEVMVRPVFGFGLKVYPFQTESSFLYGTFIGATLSFMFTDNLWEDYGMAYCGFEVGGKFEVGKLWKVSEHYFIGFTLNMGIYENATGSNYEYGDENFRIGKNPKRDPVEEINNLHLGISLTAAWK